MNPYVIRLWHIWSQTHIFPKHLVTHNWSPIDWFLWTNGPKPIQSPWKNGPQKFGPHGQIFPNQFGPPGQMVPKIFWLSRGTGRGNPEIWGPHWLGTIIQGDQKLTKFWGTVCPWWPFVQLDQLYGDLVQGDRKWGSRWVQDQMCPDYGSLICE